MITPPPVGGRRGIVIERFLSLFISLFVSLSPTLRENGWTDLHEIFTEGVKWPWDYLVQFWVNSGKRVGGSKVKMFVITGHSSESVAFARGWGLLCPAPQLVYVRNCTVYRNSVGWLCGWRYKTAKITITKFQLHHYTLSQELYHYTVSRVSSFYQRVLSKVPRPIAAKLSRMLRSECNLINWVRNLGASPPFKIWGLKQKKNSGLDFGQLPDLTAKDFGMEQDIVKRKSALKTTDTSLSGNVILFTFVH